jgi:SAM-dependent methyltransferase
MTWERLSDWWMKELASDPAYSEEIGPMLVDLLAPNPGSLYLDVGCGDGRLMEAVALMGARTIGCDLSVSLLRQARRHGPVVRAILPTLGWVRRGSVDGAMISLVLEHLEDETTLFAEVSGAVRLGGTMALIINHPIWTAPDSSPFEDPSGEVMWRPGTYFGRGHSDEPAGRRKVRFYHRTMADLLNAAADAGWHLERIEERGISRIQVDRIPEYAGQEQIPRVMGARWIRL